MLCRRSKYVDLFIFASFFLLFVYAYFSRQILLDRLHRKENEREKLEHNANSLKEELKIVYYHTAKLEEALKSEQDNHKITNSKLATQYEDFKANFTNLKKQYTDILKVKDDDIRSFSLENEDLKNKYKLAEKEYASLAQEHTKISIQVQSDYDQLKKEKEGESVHFQHQIQDAYNEKILFQKKAVTYEDDYKNTLRKLVHCKKILAKRNTTSVKRVPHVTRKKKKVNLVITKGISEISDPLPTEVVNNPNNILQNDLPSHIVSNSTQSEVLPTAKVHTFTQSKILSSKEVESLSLGNQINVIEVESPAKVPDSLLKEVPADNAITAIQKDIKSESKEIISDQKLSHMEISSPVLNEMKDKDKPDELDVPTDNT